MKAKLIDGTVMATKIRARVAEEVKKMQYRHGIIPGLAAVLVGTDLASEIYVSNKQRAAKEGGMLAKIFRFPEQITEVELAGHVKMLNADPKFHGIIVQLPLPSHLNRSGIMEILNSNKDVDGLHPINTGRLVEGKPRYIPATPAGIQQILLRSGHDPEGKHVVVCGRSDIVGKPLSSLLIQRRPGSNATVTVCHTKTRDLPRLTAQADILVAAVGRPQFITQDMVKKGAVVIDVGVNRIDAPDRKSGYRLVGDVDFGPVSEKAAAITPVPGGVGPMTIAMLLQNTLTAAQFFAHGS